MTQRFWPPFMLPFFVFSSAFLRINTPLAVASIVVKSEHTSTVDYSNLLLNRKSHISLIEALEANSGAIPRDLLQTIDRHLKNCKNDGTLSTRTNELIKEITSNFLSPLRKQLLLELLQANCHEEIQTSQIPQLKAFSESPLYHHGQIALPWKPVDPEDRLYINGYRIYEEQISKIKLYPGVFYHISYLSNTYQPRFLWARAESIEIFSPTAIVSGECDHPRFTALPLEGSPLALFSNGCLVKLEIDSGTDKNPLVNHELRETPQQITNRLWAVSASLFLLGTLYYETQKNYDISVSLPF